MKLLYYVAFFALLHTHIRLVTPKAVCVKTSLQAKAKNILINTYRFIKQVIPALPAKFVTGAVHLICTTFIEQIRKLIPKRLEPKKENIKFQFRTACNKRAYPITNLTGLAANKNFDPKKKTVLVATGWSSLVDNSHHDMLAKAYNCRGDTNYLALDFGDYLYTLYTWSSQNSDDIGKLVAKGLQHLTLFVNVANLHLLGHSLGAQIMGSAARHYRTLTGKSLPYVTGLDPALPCFSIYKGLKTLSARDADFVDIIHTNPGVFGQYETHGHVGFYVGGVYPIKGGCFTTKCSHSIVILYYTESIYPNNTRNFIAKRCKSSRRLKCNGRKDVMGYAVSRNIRGSYVVEENSQAPYGKHANLNYTDPQLTKCGTCKLAKYKLH